MNSEETHTHEKTSQKQIDNGRAMGERKSERWLSGDDETTLQFE